MTTFSDIGLPRPEAPSIPAPRIYDDRDTSTAEIRDLLDHIPPGCGYCEWLAALMAVHDETGGSSAGLDLADQWSQGGGSKYKHGEVARKWRGFEVGGGYTIATLAWMAEQHGANLPQIAAHHKRAAGYDPVEPPNIPNNSPKGEQVGEPRLVENADGELIDEETGEVVMPPEPAFIEPTGPAVYPEGLVGKIAKWIVTTARRSQPELAIAAALTIVGTAAGRQWEGPHGAGLALYVLALAPTGKGKDAPLRACKRILTAAGMGHHIGPDQWMSAPAVVQTVVSQPLALCPQDEFGSFMQRVFSKRAGTFERAIMAELRKLWGTTSGLWTSPQWASRDRFNVEAPCISIFGASTHEQFYSAMESAAIADGTLNRFLIVEGRRRVEARDPEDDGTKVPQDIIDGLKKIYLRSGELMVASLNDVTFNLALTGQQARVAWCPDGSEKLFKDFQNEIDEQADRDPGRADFMVRVAEMAARIATILAIGRDGVSVRVEDMRYGIKMARDSMNNMMSGADQYMAANEQEANVKRVLHIIKRKGHINHSGLLREVRSIQSRPLKEIIQGLVDEGSIRVQPETTKGRKGTIYVAF